MLITGVIVAIGILGPTLAFGIGAVFSNMYVTLEGKYIKIVNTKKQNKNNRNRVFRKTNQRNRYTVLGLYYRVITLILKNSAPSSISYCTRYNIVPIISVCDNYI